MKLMNINNFIKLIFYIPFIHLAEAFIQSDLQLRNTISDKKRQTDSFTGAVAVIAWDSNE